MGTGSGAYVIHLLLERHIPGYQVVSCHPNWTFIPFTLPLVAKIKDTDLIHTVPDYARFFYRKSIPLIISFQNYVIDSWMRVYSSWFQKLHYATDLKILTRMALKKATVLTAVSRFTAQLVKKDIGLNQTPIRVIHNGVDEKIFTPAGRTKTNQKRIRVFFSGNLTRRKGIHWIPEIAKHINKNICIYYTQGLRTRGILPKLANLRPVGPVPYAQMPQRYRQVDILLMPTVREGLSVAVLEAMASGLPVVASNCSSLPEQIDEGKGGFLCPIGDINSFAEKINILADSAKLRKEMGEYNRAKIEKQFTLQQMVGAYKNLFEEVLN